jgi:regulatory protein
MAGKITALKVQKKDRDRVSVYLDDRFGFGLPAIVAASLRLGQFLSDAEIEAYQEQGDIEAAYGQVLDYLAYRPRSSSEVTAYLRKRGLPAGGIEAVCSRLERAGLLDDQEFARFWVQNRERFHPRGAHALRYELQRKGVSAEIVDEALASLDSSASAYHAASQKARQLSHLDRSTFERKLVEYLGRRGFEYEVARDAAKRHWTELAEGLAPASGGGRGGEGE